MTIIERLRALAERATNPEGWYCPKCDAEIDGIQVTHTEHHERCGTYIGGESATVAALHKALSPDVVEVLLDVCEKAERIASLGIECAESGPMRPVIQMIRLRGNEVADLRAALARLNSMEKEGR